MIYLKWESLLHKDAYFIVDYHPNGGNFYRNILIIKSQLNWDCD